MRPKRINANVITSQRGSLDSSNERFFIFIQLIINTNLFFWLPTRCYNAFSEVLLVKHENNRYIGMMPVILQIRICHILFEPLPSR